MTTGTFDKPLRITVILTTLIVVSAVVVNGVFGYHQAPPILTTIGLEAEQGFIAAPMVVSSEASASGGAYIASNIGAAGSATFSIDLATDGNYVIWSRVLAPERDNDSFYVPVDGGPEDVYGVAYNTWSDAWQWTRVNGRANENIPLTLNPRIFQLSAGAHQIVFRTREADTKLDRLIITNDLSFIPGDSGPTPTPTPVPTPTPQPTPLPTPIPTTGAQFYTSPSGTSSGDGSATNPWDLTTAMNHPAALKPGDTILLRGGTYRLDTSNEPDTSYWTLTGTSAASITVRNYPGERAIIDIDYQLIVVGAFTRYIGLEFTTLRTKKVYASGWSPDRPGEFAIAGNNLKVINCIFHDMMGTSAFANSQDYEMYGNIMYYIGFIGGGTPWGTTAYVQNTTGRKDITDNLMFQQFRHNLQLYGSDAAVLKNMYVTGNTIFNPGSLTGVGAFNAALWVGDIAVENVGFTDNYFYMPTEDSSNVILWGAGSAGVVNKNLTVKDNYVIGGHPALRLGIWDPVTFTNNTIDGPSVLWYEGTLPVSRTYNWNNNKYFQGGTTPLVYAATPYDFNGWKAATGFDTTSTHSASRPTGIKVFVRPNKYEAGRAHITVINWENLDTVTISLANTGLAVGQQFEIRDAQNYFGAP
ncbi:MAG: hypothetical protein M3R15_22465, partial [Acidobacteriota bacterium]|nr:hypothetical protein [Acidobacteriota bacterium]